ncbi:MAG: hypothetical protein HY741_24690 [Chloroflexi bacterium]|nr:hypothetical protein [Chloroflexota bacterium]
MDDEFLTRYRENPRPEFARQLQERIERPMKLQKRTMRQTLLRWSPALLAASVIIAAVLVLTFPPAQALAQDFLNLFRVKKFAAITIDPARVNQLENANLDMEKLFADNVQILKEPGKPVKVASAQEAGKRAGFDLAIPSTLPQGAKLEAYVQGEGSTVLTVDTEKAQSILDTLGVNDVQIPAQLNGAKITVTKHAAVVLHYTLKKGAVTFMQAPSPEVNLPPGVNLAQLGEIALRVLGLSKQEAHDFAQKVDWSSTFLVPIPADAGEVRQVSVNGAEGLMITSNGAAKNQRGPLARGDAVILWASNGMVYAMEGNSNAVDLLELANSVQ